MFKAKVSSHSMKIVFEYSDKHTDVKVFMSYLNKMPTAEDNVYNNPNSIEVRGHPSVYLCVLSETDTNITIRTITKKSV